jgi:hypothetical protein
MHSADPLFTIVSGSIVIALAAAWLTHVVWFTAAVFKGISRSNLVWGLAGILIPILGMLHGLAIWLEASQWKGKA